MTGIETSIVLSQLEEWGVSNPRQGNEGILIIPQEGLFEVYDYNERDLYPLLSKIRTLLGSRIETTGTRPGLIQTKYIDPVIDYSIVPTEIYNVEINLTPWNLYVKGTIKGKQDNKSSEGQKCTKYLIERQWTCETVQGSADIKTNTTNTMNAADQNLRLFSNLAANYGKVAPKNSINASATWRTSGAWDWLVAVVNILLTGSCRTAGGIDATAEYTWRDEKYTKQKHFDVDVRLPIRGNIVYTWN